MTMVDVGRCIGSGQQPSEGTERTEDGRTTGVCVACAGRFEVEDGHLVAHATAPADERETTSEPS